MKTFLNCSRLVLLFLLIVGPAVLSASDGDESSAFSAITVSPGEGEAEVSWVLDYDEAPKFSDKDVLVRYLTSINFKRLEDGMDIEWNYSEPVSALDNTIEISGLKQNEKYVFELGYPDQEGQSVSEYHWSEKVKAKTKRGWGLARALMLLGALGLFIFGMKIMSDGLQRAAGERLRKMLGSITSNRVKGVLTGFFSTAIVQSSSVTTVMTVSLVNAGLLTLRQSAGVMMGANIGTTITGWLILLLGFKVSVSDYALMLIAIGAPLLFMTFRRSKDISNAIIGFAILFLGLQFLKDGVPDLDKDSAIVRFFVEYKDIPFLSNILFVALGALVTVIIQSSSAAMALTLTLVSKGVIPFEVACAMVLGENIGTTITAEIASAVGNVHAKRSARIHSMFNVVGVTWMLILMGVFLEGVKWVVELAFIDVPFDPTNEDHATEGITTFHTLFNLANVVIMIWFVPQLVRIAERTVRSGGDSDEEFKLQHIGGSVVVGAGVALIEAKQEVARFGQITSRMTSFTRVLLNDLDKKKRRKMFDKIAKYEEITDRFEVEVSKFLEKVSQNEMSEKESIEVRSILSITNDLERIGDIFFQLSKGLERKEERKIYFHPKQRERLNEMLDKVDEAFVTMNDNLNADYGEIDVNRAREIEDDINNYRDKLRRKYHNRLNEGDENIQGSMIYNDVFSQCEKVGDHIINVSEAVAGMI